MSVPIGGGPPIKLTDEQWDEIFFGGVAGGGGLGAAPSPSPGVPIVGGTNPGGGGMITAALFLSKFAGDGPWVHIDIASTDWSERERAYIPKGPTGVGTRLLIQYLIDRSL